jgi:hypothetical protein
VRNAVIRDRLNQLDGPQISNDGTLYGIAHRLGLRTRGEIWAEQDAAAAPAPDEAPPASPEAPAAWPDPPPASPQPTAEAPPVETPTLSFPEDAQGREVWEAFDSGMSVRDVGADFGIPLSTLTNTHAQWQLARRKELAQ